MKDYSPIYQRTFFVVLWVLSTFGFISDEILPPLESMSSIVNLLADVVLATLAVCIIRNRLHLACIGVFVLVSCYITCFYNNLSTIFWVNGLRDFIGLLTAYPILCYFYSDPVRRQRFVESLDKQLLIFLVLQAFCIPFQMLQYGEGDHGGGSFGNWYSGQVSICIYAISFYLMHKRLDTSHFFASLNRNKILILLLFPTFLNETKVSFVLIVLYFLLLMPLDRKFFTRALWITPTAALLLFIGINVYQAVESNSHEDIFSEEYLIGYFMLDDPEHAESDALWNMDNGTNADVPRITKFMYLPILNEQEPGHVWTGFGIGQFKGGTNMDLSEFAYEYDWLLMGSIPYMFHTYIQLGIIGVAMLLAWLAVIFGVRPSWVARRDYNVQLLVIFIVMLLFVHIDILRNPEFCMILFAIFTSSWLPRETTDNEPQPIPAAA